MNLDFALPVADPPVRPASAATFSPHVATCLVGFVQRLAGIRSLDALMAEIREAVSSLTNSDGVTFVMLEGNQCYYADEQAIGPLFRGQRFSDQVCIAGWAMRHREPAVVRDVLSDPRVPKGVYDTTFVRSLVMVPVGRTNPRAAIGTYWARVDAFTNDDVCLLQTIADTAALAMDNLELYHWLRRIAEEQSAMHEAARRDIARRVEIEREMRAAKEKLERSLQSKSRLMAALSHDLRQPLQSQALFVAILAQIMAEDAIGTEALRHLEGGVARMSQMLDSILELSSLDAGIIHPQWAPVALGPIMAEMVEEMGALAQERGLRLHWVPTRLTGMTDPRLLATMLRNLIANAIRYTQSGGIVVGCRRHGNSVFLQVCDTGSGIPADRLELIFEEFYQVGNAARDARMGLGLGLAIVERTAKLLGHQITVRSVEGRGSCFTIEIPASGAAA